MFIKMSGSLVQSNDRIVVRITGVDIEQDPVTDLTQVMFNFVYQGEHHFSPEMLQQLDLHEMIMTD